MQDNPVGVTFRETMAGGFVLGEADPGAGEKKGKIARTILTMHATITIQDLGRFISDTDHTGSISGEISFPPLGEKIPAGGGTFNLFSPAGDPEMKWMIYGLAFKRGGQEYYLAGKKEVRDDPGFDLWKDTTTLLTRLHRGKDTTAPVAGAGILTLSPAELLKLLSSLRVTGARSSAEEARALRDFGLFFLGQLWDTYIARVAK